MKCYYFDDAPKNEDFLKIVNDNKKIESQEYIKKLVYHKINWLSVIVNILIFSVLVLSTVLTLWFLTYNLWITVLASTFVGILYIVFRMKSILVFLIMIYQHLAPKRIRIRCRFEPSCSEYSIQAIEKYGVLKGVRKSINRLCRCSYPNGGIDEP